MSKFFVVNMREVHIQSVEVEASDREDAIRKVVDGEGEYVNDCLEYSHTLDPESWTIDECPKK